MGEWRKIATLHIEEGERVLVYAPEDGVQVAEWAFRDRLADYGWLLSRQDDMPEDDYGIWIDRGDVTHWMPLPAAPDTASATEQVGMERTAEPGA